jgi:predicted nucleic acid-binding protein
VLRRWVEDQVLPAFAGRVLPVTEAIARRSTALHVPDPCAVFDGLTAATALAHNMHLGTRNLADFAFDGLKVSNPWQPVTRRR